MIGFSMGLRIVLRIPMSLSLSETDPDVEKARPLSKQSIFPPQILSRQKMLCVQSTKVPKEQEPAWSNIAM